MTIAEAKGLFEEELKDGKCSDDCPECNAKELAIQALEFMESVVRCKDCRFWDYGRCEAPENGLIREYTMPVDFCSYGERKDGADG